MDSRFKCQFSQRIRGNRNTRAASAMVVCRMTSQGATLGFASRSATVCFARNFAAFSGIFKAS